MNISLLKLFILSILSLAYEDSYELDDTTTPYASTPLTHSTTAAVDLTLQILFAIKLSSATDMRGPDGNILYCAFIHV